MGSDGETATGSEDHTILMGRFARWAAITGVCAAALFLLQPQIDLIVSHAFYLGQGRFSGQASLLVIVIRNAFLTLYVISVAAAVVGLVMALRGAQRWFELDGTQWVFVALCLSVGPGLVANHVFKDNWGRARPVQVSDFAGHKPFSPALVAERNCTRNCSFVSGEASSIFALMFAAAALFRRRARMFIAAGIVLGGLAGLIRVAQGAHFLSDVVFAGVFMALTVTALFFLFEVRAAGGMTRVRSSLSGVRHARAA